MTIQPALYIVLDTETGNPPEDKLAAAVRRAGELGRRDPQALEEKAALLDAAPTLAIVCKTPTQAAVFNGMPQAVQDVAGIPVANAGDERGELIRFRAWLDSVAGPETVLVGFNVLEFDLPRLRAAYVRQRLRLPSALDPCAIPAQPVADLMKIFLRYYTSERKNDRYIKLAHVAELLNLPQTKQVVSGAEVPAMAQAGRAKEILTYCLVDVLTTEQAYLLLNGRHPTMQ